MNEFNSGDKVLISKTADFSCFDDETPNPFASAPGRIGVVVGVARSIGIARVRVDGIEECVPCFIGELRLVGAVS